MTNDTGYNSGHPWYYILGGKVLPPKEILKAVEKTGYEGYCAILLKYGSFSCPLRI